MEPTKFSLILKQCRENAGLTQKQMSTALNIERSAYAYYECGQTRPSAAFILKVASVLNIDYSVFFYVVDDDENHLDNECIKSYELSKQQKELIIAYRAMPKEKRNEIDNICKTFFKNR